MKFSFREGWGEIEISQVFPIVTISCINYYNTFLAENNIIDLRIEKVKVLMLLIKIFELNDKAASNVHMTHL